MAGEKTFPVPREAIEDKPVASNLPGFDEFAKITIPYTGVQVGESVRLRTRTTRREVAFPGHFCRGNTCIRAGGPPTLLRA